MTKANHDVFTTEEQLTNRLTQGTGEIDTFWQQGDFSFFTGVNNIRINYATFMHDETTTSSTNKCLIISSGRSESYLKYKELSFDLFNQGYNLFLLDHRGQGLSERTLKNFRKGHVENFQYYVDDFAYFIKNIVTPNCQHKPYILAHSMGAAITARYLQDFPNNIQAVLLASPMFGFNEGNIPKFIAKLVIKIIAQVNQWFDSTPWYFFGHKDFIHKSFASNQLTHSLLRYQIFTDLYQETPNIQLGGVTTQWIATSLIALKEIFANINKITTPTLIVQAGNDNIVNNQAQNDFCQQLHALQPQSCPSNKPLVIEGAYHELFFERDIYRKEVLTTIINWFEQHPCTNVKNTELKS